MDESNADTADRIRDSEGIPVVVIFDFLAMCFLDLEEFDPFLGPYPYEHLSKWVSLTNHITEDLVSRYTYVAGTRKISL